MTQDEPTYTIETIADVDLWDAIVDAVNTVGSKPEAAFEFEGDRLRIRHKDAGNVAMVAQTVDADGFDHYDVDGKVVIGIDTAKFDDLLGVADADDAVKFNLNAETRRFEFEAGGVEYDLSGIQPDTIEGSPVDVPGLDNDYIVDATLPVDKWSKASDVVELCASSGKGMGYFEYDADGGTFYLEGRGDNDRSRVDLTDHEDFGWNEDAPTDDVTVVMDNGYMTNVIDVLESGDEDVVRFVTGSTLPYHVWTTHADGRVDTKLMQAPRIVSE